MTTVGTRRRVAVEGNAVAAVAEAPIGSVGSNATNNAQLTGVQHERGDFLPHADGDTVTFTWGKELYSPKGFHTVEIGPFVASTALRPGETRLQAYDRIAKETTAFAEANRKSKLDSYKRQMGEV